VLLICNYDLLNLQSDVLLMSDLKFYFFIEELCSWDWHGFAYDLIFPWWFLFLILKCPNTFNLIMKFLLSLWSHSYDLLFVDPQTAKIPFFLSLSRWAETKAFILCCEIVWVSFEWRPRKLDVKKRIFVLRFQAIDPRLTLVIGLMRLSWITILIFLSVILLSFLVY